MGLAGYKRGHDMDKKIRMIAADLDGTLLKDDKTVDPYTLEIISKVIKQGIIFVVATGRPYNGVPKELLDIEGMQYAITSNGARVVDISTGKAIIHKLLPREKGIKALEIGAKFDTLQEIYYDGQGYADRDKMQNVEKYHRNPNMWNYFRQTRKQVDSVMDMALNCEKDMDKMQILFPDLNDRELALEEVLKIEDINAVDSIGYNIEVNSKEAHKGAVLKELADMLSIDISEVMAFGDGDNDASMIKEAGFGVAMGNSGKMALEVADYVTETNDNNGVAKAIEKFVLMRGEKQ